MASVNVQLGSRSYSIEIGTDTLGQLAAWSSELLPLSHAVLITDSNVDQPHARAVAAGFTAEGVDVDLLTVDAGEESKSVEMAAQLWDELLDAGTDRKSVVFAIGGGVIGDLAGFVAATFARGLSFVQVPTTLLAMVDSSVGGKVGVNLPQAKNMVGAFWQPRGVWIDTATLATLPDREYCAGLAEVVKYGMILDADFFEYLETHAGEILARQSKALEHIIARSCRLKADVVEQDEREETGLRAILNYGHTFAHAVEAVTGYGQWLHGEAVSVGMMCAARLAQRLDRIDWSLVVRQQKLLVALGLPVEMPELDEADLLAAMQRDKKVEHGRLRFVLPSRLGEVELVGDIEPDDVHAALYG